MEEPEEPVSSAGSWGLDKTGLLVVPEKRVADDGACGDVAGEGELDGRCVGQTVEVVEVLCDGQLARPRAQRELLLDDGVDELADGLDLVVAELAGGPCGREAEAASGGGGRTAGDGDEVLDQLVAHHLLGETENAVELAVLRGGRGVDDVGVGVAADVGVSDRGDAHCREGALGDAGELQRPERGHHGAGKRVLEPLERCCRVLVRLLLLRAAAAAAALADDDGPALLLRPLLFLDGLGRSHRPLHTAAAAALLATVAVTVVQRTEHVVLGEHAAGGDRRELGTAARLHAVAVVTVVFVVPVRAQHESGSRRRRQRQGQPQAVRAAPLVSVFVAVVY